MAMIILLLTSWNAEAVSSFAYYQDYANGDALRVLCPDVMVELLELAPASAFSSSIC